MTTKEKIEVMQAYEEGKTIECNNKRDSDSDWFELDQPEWNWAEYEYRIAPIEPLPQPPKFKEGDTVRIQDVVPIGVVLRYEGGVPIVDYGSGEVGYQEDSLELFIPLTREEITAQWVRDNNVKVGDMVKLLKCGSIGEVTKINKSLLIVHFGGITTCVFAVEELKKVTKRLEKFTFEDRELFRDKWVRRKDEPFTSKEFLITFISDEKIKVGSDFYTYEESIDMLEFINGKPFGKEVWE